MSEKCPCQSGLLWLRCCGRFIDGDARADTAEALMRSRFSAFVKKDTEYLMETWHEKSRPPILKFDEGDPSWHSLEVIAVKRGKVGDNSGVVEFIASGQQNGKMAVLRERSQFVKQRGEWVYLEGEIMSEAAGTSKVGRNSPCSCGSGLKFKRCCGRAG